MTTASSLLGATASNFMPAGVSAGASVDEVGVAAGCSPFPHAASTEPAPTASTATPLACSIERRDTALAMSPKYSLSLVLRTGLAQASPHLYRHVTCCRLDLPSWVTKRFNGTRAMGAVPSTRIPAGGCRPYAPKPTTVRLAAGNQKVNSRPTPNLPIRQVPLPSTDRVGTLATWPPTSLTSHSGSSAGCRRAAERTTRRFRRIAR